MNGASGIRRLGVSYDQLPTNRCCSAVLMVILRWESVILCDCYFTSACCAAIDASVRSSYAGLMNLVEGIVTAEF